MNTNRLNPLDVKNPSIRTLHFTWVAFFITFVVWFNHAPMGKVITEAFGLSKAQWKALLILNVALTIPARGGDRDVGRQTWAKEDLQCVVSYFRWTLYLVCFRPEL